MSVGADDWITPAEAVRMVALPGSFAGDEAKQRIISRAQEGLIRARVRDAILRKLVKKKDGDAPQSMPDANGVHPLGAPLPVWDWPVEKERRSNHELEEEEWMLPGLSDPRHEWWETGDLELHSTNGTREGVKLFGIEFSRVDILNMRPAAHSGELNDKFTFEGAVKLGLTGRYLATDFPLLLLMDNAIKAQGLSERAAAMQFAGRAEGVNTQLASRGDRLRSLYSQWEALGG